MTSLDYSIQSPEERKKIVDQILKENPNPTSQYLEVLSNYLILCMEKQEKKQKKILTDNRMATITKRETSFEGLVSQLENGEDGIYNLIKNDKTIIFRPKITITKKDLEEIPYLKQLREAIEDWEKQLKNAKGRKAYIIKKALIEMRKDQYIIKNAFRKPVVTLNKNQGGKYYPRLEDTTYRLTEDNYPIPEGVSLLNPKICSIILCNYMRLYQRTEGVLTSDAWHLLFDFNKLAKKALEPYPMYQKIVEYKISGYQNREIQEKIYNEFDILHSVEYISSLWRKKIPKIIASAAEDEWLNWYYLNKEYGKYKKCSRCGEIKLAHNKYFSKNKTSKDTFYSICKKCRNKKQSEVK